MTLQLQYLSGVLQVTIRLLLCSTEVLIRQPFWYHNKGIGQAMAEAFARYTQGNAHIIIIGRNRAAAQASIDSFPKPTSTAFTHEFVQCDATLMKNVHETTSSLLARLPKVNFLVMSTGIFILAGRNETTEGIDDKMALAFYARAKFTNDLMPLLQKAADAGEDAKVYSILAAGQGGKIDLEDLGLKKHHSVMNCAIAVSTYTDLFMEVRRPFLLLARVI